MLLFHWTWPALPREQEKKKDVVEVDNNGTDWGRWNAYAQLCHILLMNFSCRLEAPFGVYLDDPI